MEKRLNTAFSVNIPYSPTMDEQKHREHLVVRALDEKGAWKPVVSGRYDSQADAVVFSTPRFGQYGIAYEQSSFEDIGEAEWARKAVEVLASKGAINGVSQTHFDPKRPVTRGEFVQMLVATILMQASDNYHTDFKDVLRDDDYYEAVSAAQALGIVNGAGSKRFLPQALITREEMFVMAHRALQLAEVGLMSTDASELTRFEDYERVSKYAIESVQTLIDNGIVQGAGVRLNPKGIGTRAESAMLLYRLYNTQFHTQ